MHIHATIPSVSECQSDESADFVIFFTILITVATSLEIFVKDVKIIYLHPERFRTLSFGEKIAKIGPADPEIIVL